MNLGSKIDKLMGKRRIATQRDLARLAKVTKSSLGRWINGEAYPPLDEAARLARVLETSLDYLASESDEDLRNEEDLSDDERFIIRLYRDLNLSRPEAARRLSRCEVKAPGGGPMKVIGDRDLSHLSGDEEEKDNGSKNGGKGGQDGGKAGGPSPRK